MDREAEERKQQRLVFVSDGSKTPNGCYYYYGKVLQADRLRHPYWKGLVRELTEERVQRRSLPALLWLLQGAPTTLC